jgi:hypothetical protein
MKYFIFIGMFVLFQMQAVFAQQINNAGFENWQMQGLSFVPDFFFSDDQLSSNCCNFTSQTFDAHSGQYAAMIIPSPLFISMNNLNQLNYGSFTAGLPTSFGGWPFALRPGKLKFWYKYVNAGSDTATAYIALSKWTGSSSIIGQGSISITGNVASYTLAEVAINYLFGVNPDTLILGFSSAKPGFFNPGTELYIDDIYLDYTTGISTLDANSGFELYPSITSGNFTIKDHFSNGKSSLRITNTLGEIVYTQKLTGDNDFLIQTQLRAGVYFVILDNDSKRYCKKIIIESTSKM